MIHCFDHTRSHIINLRAFIDHMTKFWKFLLLLQPNMANWISLNWMNNCLISKSVKLISVCLSWILLLQDEYVPIRINQWMIENAKASLKISYHSSQASNYRDNSCWDYASMWLFHNVIVHLFLFFLFSLCAFVPCHIFPLQKVRQMELREMDIRDMDVSNQRTLLWDGKTTFIWAIL